MKPTLSFFFIIASILFFASCIPVMLMPKPNCKKKFDVFEHPISDRNSGKLKTNGIYISETGNASFFLYNNGKTKLHRGPFQEYPQKYMLPIAKVLNEMEKEAYFNSKELWGDYEIKGNNIKVQGFNGYHWAREAVCKRSVFENIGKIVDDSTIEIYSEYSYLGKDTFFSGSCIMHYYPVTTKPDSTKAWFNGKKWYKEQLHESRKVK
jgi:hypothetical protein